ncbi:MAG: hypothetical protein ACK4M3_02385 [Pyrobaculum sp.]
MILRPPPRVKILEALGALVDGRVHMVAEGRCEVTSSEGDRKYHVVIQGSEAYSDDNGTMYRGYVGYPIIACLMAAGVLPVDMELGKKIREVPWRKLNQQFKKYEEVMKYIYRERNIESQKAERYVDMVTKKLKEMQLRKK